MDESDSSDEQLSENEPVHRIGSYRILDAVGAGGMSAVFRAVHEKTGHQVVLKVLTRALARNGTLLQRFIREARSAETLEHQNIVTIYDRGIDRGRHYLVLEYVEGGDFHEYVVRYGPLPLDEAMSVVRTVASGLRYAASRGLIHRDIKPSNILRTPAGQVKIIDLGLALQDGFEDERVTREGTTVGTVDYMSPEQARDSRATSIQSDIYSLGCTFYYLLAGSPPFPGGDITEKLTHHARSPAPDVREIRPDVPMLVSSVIQKMMAKRPDDRFISYDELIESLDNVSPGNEKKSSEVSPIPLAGDEADDPPSLSLDSESEPSSGGNFGNEADSDSLKYISLAELALEHSDEFRERPPATPRPVAAGPMAPLPRRGRGDGPRVTKEGVDDEELALITPTSSASSAFIWVIAGVLVCIAVLFLTIGLLQFTAVTPPPRKVAPPPTVTNIDIEDRGSPSEIKPVVAVGKTTHPSKDKLTVSPKDRKVGRGETRRAWAEPTDPEPPNHARALIDNTISQLLPEWATSVVPDRIDGPFVVVRRVAEPSGVFTVPTLYMAFDQRIGGTVEIADEGPFFNDNFRVAGETRLIRARRGYRPIVRVERSSSESVRKQPAVFVFDRQNVTLEGIDFVVDVRDVHPEQTALFACTASGLTLKDCSITIQNPNNTPFSIVRVGPSEPRPTQIRLEGSFLRGAFTAGIDLIGNSAEVAICKCVIAGGPGPVVRVANSRHAGETRLFFVESIATGPGPLIELVKKERGGPVSAIPIRAYGCIFARLPGAGVRAVISSTSSAESAANQIDWKGNNNLFTGWTGFFAAGNDHVVTVAGLPEVRSTWNGADRESQEIAVPWPQTGSLVSVTLEELQRFIPNRENLLRQVAHPRAGLFEKAVGAYSPPAIPQPVGWAFEPPGPFPVNTAPQQHQRAAGSKTNEAPGSVVAVPPPGVSKPGANSLDLDFDTLSARWAGDLGAFLRERLTPAVRHARVRVTGSGHHRFTPVRFAQDLWLEIRVEPLVAAEPPSWSPSPSSTGSALMELRGGALVLSKLVLRHEASSRIEHLIAVADGQLVLSRCQLSAPASSPGFAGNLISFRAATTQPDLIDPARPVFATPVIRPVCSLRESVLIAGGTALKAELGRGLVALTQCAIAAGATGVELLPSKVSRQRFDADLVMDHCTLTSEKSIVRLGPWRGATPGPDRPWLITSRNCAFLSMYDRKSRETVLLRSDADALASGAVSWQASNDAADVDFFAAIGEGLPSLNRSRDLPLQWVHFWGNNHMNGRITGPHGAGTPPSVRFFERLRPGRIEPVDLVLNPDYHPDRDKLNVGAELQWLRIARPARGFGRPPF